MKILLIGSGNRAKAYATYLKDDIAYVCDVVRTKAELLINEYNLKNATALTDYEYCTDAEAIIIAVPDYKHDRVFSWAIKQDVAILLEKPVAVTKESLNSMYMKGINYQNTIILGFTLRYTFMYTRIMELLGQKAIGDVISVEASESLDPVHAAKFFRRWHRHSENSGGFLNTKCSHDMDMINQIVPGNPIHIASFGRNSVFIPGKGLQRCSNKCPEYNSCRFIDNNTYKFSTADTGICPYNIDSDIVDHQVVSMEFDSGVTAVFTVTMHSDKGDRHIRIHGTKGSISASFSDQKVYLKITGEEDIIFSPESTLGSHGGGDKILCSRFLNCIISSCAENQIRDGVMASSMALAADASRAGGKIIDMTSFAGYMFNKK